MKTKYLLIFNLLISLIVSSQQVPLKGVVSIVNSEYTTGTREYVSGAIVSAEFAKNEKTDSDGAFILEFSKENSGKVTKLNITKEGYEVVNEKELKNVIIGNNSLLQVYMCKEGELAENQAKYYNASLKNIYEERDKRIKILEKGGLVMQGEIDRMEVELDAEIYTKKEALVLLNQQVKALEKNLSVLAEKLAEVNLDDTSHLYKRAFELYTQGNLKEAISLLSIDEILPRGVEAMNDLKVLREQEQITNDTIASLENLISQTIKSLRLGAEFSAHNLKFQQAIKYYEAIITILENDPKGREDDIGYFSSMIGSALAFTGRYPESLKYYQKALDYHQKIYSESHPKIANDYFDLGNIYHELGFFKQSLAYQKKALKIRNGLYGEFHPFISECYSQIARTYTDVDSLNMASKYQKKALDIDLKILKHPHENIAKDYYNLARIQYDLKDYSNALIYINKALEIKKKLSGDESLSIMWGYVLQASIYKVTNQLDKLLVSQKNALRIFKLYFDETHPRFPSIYNHLALTYQDLGILDTALTMQKKAIKLYKPTNTLRKDKKLILLKYDLADIHYSIGKKEFTLKNYQEALNHFEAALKSHWDRGNICNYSGMCFMKLKRYPSARIRLYESVLGEYRVSRDVFLINMGTVEAKTGEYKSALKYFDEYKKRNPKDGKAYRNYAMYYALKNNSKMAIEMLRKAAELGYNDIDWLRTDDSMNSLQSLPEFQEILKKME